MDNFNSTIFRKARVSLAQNSKEDLNERLFNSCEKSNYPIVKFLIKNCGADINAKDKDGWTPLHFAVNFGDVEIVKFMLNNGAKISPQILNLAANGGHLDVVKFLIKGATKMQILTNSSKS